MAKGLHWLAWTLVGVIAMMVVGCAGRTVYVPLEPPVTQPEASVGQEATLMEEYQEVVRLYEAEKAGNLSLREQLAQETLGRETAEADVEALRERVGALEAEVAAKAELEQKYTETCEELLKLSKVVPELQRKFLKEQLARIKHEQTIVALKIESAIDSRRQMLETGLRGSDAPSEDSNVDKETDDANL